jgi:hypothetical protein
MRARIPAFLAGAALLLFPEQKFVFKQLGVLEILLE